MAVRSRRFFIAAVPLASTYTTLYTVPADRVARFSRLNIVNGSASATTAIIRVGPAASPLSYWYGTIPAASAVELEEGLCLGEGDVLQAFTSVADAIRVYGGGSLLDGDPS